MVAFISNISLLEIVLIAVVAIMVFGRRLPEVAGQAAAQFLKLKRSLADLRRETGIDEELRRAREVAYEATRAASRPSPIRKSESLGASDEKASPSIAPPGTDPEPTDEV